MALRVGGVDGAWRMPVHRRRRGRACGGGAGRDRRQRPPPRAVDAHVAANREARPAVSAALRLAPLANARDKSRGNRAPTSQESLLLLERFPLRHTYALWAVAQHGLPPRRARRVPPPSPLGARQPT